jgi:hypothetical protein
MTTLGTLKAIDPRDVWAHEAADFTPWLASPESIERLGEAIGMELAVEHTEVAVGPFAADIVARDTASGSYVVIENQLNRTDHDHLGKALTYAAALNANAVLWIAPTFTDEHRRVIDWLNDNSADDLSFYGIQLELWSVDDSKPAVRFNVVARPAEIVRQAALRAQGDLTPTRRLQLEWWTAFRDALVASKAVPSVQSPRAQYWYNVALGRSGYVLSCTANVDIGRIGVRVYLTSRFGGDAALAQLIESREAIESEIGAKLIWNPNPEAMDKIIVVHREADLAKRADWPAHLKWMVDTTSRMRRVFGPRIRALDLSDVADGTAATDLDEGT